jgi:hypothetical protein
LEGTLAYKQGAYNKVLTHHTQAGDDPHVQYRDGMASKKLGDTKQARAYFEKAAKANPPSRSFALIRNRAMEEVQRRVARACPVRGGKAVKSTKGPFRPGRLLLWIVEATVATGGAGGSGGRRRHALAEGTARQSSTTKIPRR